MVRVWMWLADNSSTCFRRVSPMHPIELIKWVCACFLLVTAVLFFVSSDRLCAVDVKSLNVVRSKIQRLGERLMLYRLYHFFGAVFGDEKTLKSKSSKGFWDVHWKSQGYS